MADANGGKVERRHPGIEWDSGIGEILLGLRHEINNPLTSLILNVELLKEAGHIDAAELVEGIEIAAKQIAAIVRRLESLRPPEQNSTTGGKAMDESKDDSASGTPARKGSTILVVDDEESVRAVVAKILLRNGHKVLEAEHGADAVRIAAAHDGAIDLLITDMYMPGLRGSEILEKIAPTRPALKVLYMSGYANEDIERSGVGSSAAFLRKPFSAQELSEAVEKVLPRRSRE